MRYAASVPKRRPKVTHRQPPGTENPRHRSPTFQPLSARSPAGLGLGAGAQGRGAGATAGGRQGSDSPRVGGGGGGGGDGGGVRSARAGKRIVCGRRPARERINRRAPPRPAPGAASPVEELGTRDPGPSGNRTATSVMFTCLLPARGRLQACLACARVPRTAVRTVGPGEDSWADPLAEFGCYDPGSLHGWSRVALHAVLSARCCFFVPILPMRKLRVREDQTTG